MQGIRGGSRAAAWAAVILGLAASAAPSFSTAAVPRFTVVDLGTLGGPGSYATAVSDTGFVVGCSDMMPEGVHAFIYFQGAMRDLGSASDDGGNSCALAVNDAGTAAGRAGNGDLVAWSGGSVTRLGVKGNVGAINDAGAIVGSHPDGARTVAFLYQAGKLMDIGDPAVSSEATAINAQGEVVGASDGRAFLFRDGALRDLGTLGGGSSVAKGINDRGEVVGMASDEHGIPGAFLFDGTLRALPGAQDSAAVDINDRAEIIGSAEGSFGYIVVRDALTRLDALPEVRARGLHRVEPAAINNRGWIVGTAVNAQGDTRAVLLVPAAEAGLGGTAVNPGVVVAVDEDLREPDRGLGEDDRERVH
jgi:probable HAF family extracellular repeat protein